MTEALVEKVARAISASKQGNGNTAAVAAQYIETFWRDYLPEARIAVSILTAAPAPAAAWLCTHNNGSTDATTDPDRAEWWRREGFNVTDLVRRTT